MRWRLFRGVEKGNPLRYSIPAHPSLPPFKSHLMDKTALVAALIATLREELDAYARASRAAHEAATDPQSKAENKYDTRGLESSYLARGQALRAAEAESALAQLQSLVLPPPGCVEVGSLVVLGTTAGERTYFLAPAAGGKEITFEGRQIRVLTPASPLGVTLLDHRTGDRFALEIGGMGMVTVTAVF